MYSAEPRLSRFCLMMSGQSPVLGLQSSCFSILRCENYRWTWSGPTVLPSLPSIRCFNPTVYQINLNYKDWEAVGGAIHLGLYLCKRKTVWVWMSELVRSCHSAAAAPLHDDIRPTALGLSKGDIHTEGVWGRWHIPVLSTVPSSCCSASHFWCVIL